MEKYTIDDFFNEIVKNKMTWQEAEKHMDSIIHNDNIVIDIEDMNMYQTKKEKLLIEESKKPWKTKKYVPNYFENLEKARLLVTGEQNKIGSQINKVKDLTDNDIYNNTGWGNKSYNRQSIQDIMEKNKNDLDTDKIYDILLHAYPSIGAKEEKDLLDTIIIGNEEIKNKIEAEQTIKNYQKAAEMTFQHIETICNREHRRTTKRESQLNLKINMTGQESLTPEENIEYSNIQQNNKWLKKEIEIKDKIELLTVIQRENIFNKIDNVPEKYNKTSHDYEINLKKEINELNKELIELIPNQDRAKRIHELFHDKYKKIENGTIKIKDTKEKLKNETAKIQTTYCQIKINLAKAAKDRIILGLSKDICDMAKTYQRENIENNDILGKSLELLTEYAYSPKFFEKYKELKDKEPEKNKKIEYHNKMIDAINEKRKAQNLALKPKKELQHLTLSSYTIPKIKSSLYNWIQTEQRGIHITVKQQLQIKKIKLIQDQLNNSELTVEYAKQFHNFQELSQIEKIATIFNDNKNQEFAEKIRSKILKNIDASGKFKNHISLDNNDIKKISSILIKYEPDELNIMETNEQNYIIEIAKKENLSPTEYLTIVNKEIAYLHNPINPDINWKEKVLDLEESDIDNLISLNTNKQMKSLDETITADTEKTLAQTLIDKETPEKQTIINEKEQKKETIRENMAEVLGELSEKQRKVINIVTGNADEKIHNNFKEVASILYEKDIQNITEEETEEAKKLWTDAIDHFRNEFNVYTHEEEKDLKEINKEQSIKHSKSNETVPKTHEKNSSQLRNHSKGFER